MKTQEIIDKAVIVVATLIAAVLIVMLAIARSAQAADYWILKDGAHRDAPLLLTNQKPQAGQTVVRHYDLQDASAEEVRAAQAAEATLRAEFAAQERTRAIERLAAEIAKVGAVREPPVPVNVGMSVGGTTVQPRIIVRGKGGK